MKTEAPSYDRDYEATAPPGRSASRDESRPIAGFTLTLFVVAELLCTGALVASLILWI